MAKKWTIHILVFCSIYVLGTLCVDRQNLGIDPCLSGAVCLGRGTCEDYDFGYLCSCTNGFVGVNCQYDSMSIMRHIVLWVMKPWQTSTNGASLPARAVDGDLATCSMTEDNANPQMWLLDLGRTYFVYSIRISPHESNVLSNALLRMAPFWAEKGVDMYSVPCTSSIGSDWPEQNNYEQKPAPHVFSCLQHGQFVIIKQNNHVNNMIVLCEVEIAIEDMGKDKNIAMNKTAFQSSIFKDSSNQPMPKRSAEYALDNDVKTCTWTESSDNPFWYVDLFEKFLIRAVRVVGFHLLQHLLIGATDTEPDSDISALAMDKIRWCAKPDEQSTVNLAIGLVISCWEKGQYLVIMHEGLNKLLSLCTVEVYGSDLVDECASNPCRNGGSCHDMDQGYTCTCNVGIEGTHCETFLDQCSSEPCANGGTCSPSANGFSCVCTPEYAEYRELNCVPDADECSSTPCFNGASCKDKVNGYTCECAAGGSGINCEIYDECHFSPCLNGGSCKDRIEEYICECAAGFTGTHCEIMLSLKIKGYDGPIDEGQALNLVCEVTGYGDGEAKPQYVWKFTPKGTSSELEVAWEKSYFKKILKEDDAGVYSCSIMNRWSTLSANLTVDVIADGTSAPIQDVPGFSSANRVILGVSVCTMIGLFAMVGVVLVKKRILKLPNGKFPTFTLKQKDSTKDDLFPIHPSKTKEDHIPIQPRKTKRSPGEHSSRKVQRRQDSDSTKTDQKKPR